ncbi:hypothetical protein AnigIFM60653_009905 [Aspergillus niger]|nr:hypothetical protein AnigIFM50267_006728 [Aspergillus niger]GLA08374.1 hypothetical protein AnigIFM60653_009905 [Aspergillus niger]
MATATKICLTPAHGGVYSVPGLSWASARKVSEVLQHDMENHHVYLNNIGFHGKLLPVPFPLGHQDRKTKHINPDHVVHFMLTIWALGASPETIQLQYEREAKRQRPALPRDEALVSSFHDKKKFMKFMYQEEQYSNYLAFFQGEITRKGVAALAESLLSRMFAGLVHPIIHLGFGIEFQQPAIVAQALVQASVHHDYLADRFYRPTEALSASTPQTSKALVEIIAEMRRDEYLRDAALHGDTEIFEDGILKRADAAILKYCSQWKVPEDQIDEKLVEMINTAIDWTATAQKPKKELKLDFFYIHALNLSIFFKAFVDLPYLKASDKARLLEMKGRMDLLMWASRKMPEPQPDDIMNYPIHLGWPEVFAQSYLHPSDDGHLSKFVRTVAFAEQLCRPYEDSKTLPVRGDMWLKIGNIAVDSVGVIFQDLWVRGSGFSESWEKFGPRT